MYFCSLGAHKWVTISTSTSGGKLYARQRCSNPNCKKERTVQI